MPSPRSKTAPRSGLFLTEHMAAKGFSDQTLADKLGVARNTVYRWRTEVYRLDPSKLEAIAEALDLDNPGDLWRPPGRRSIDAMLAGADEAQIADTAAFVERFVLHRRE